MKEGWVIKKLDDACEVEYGTRVVRKRDGGSIYPVYGGGGATFFMDTFNREDCMVVARFAMSEKCTRFVNDKFFLNDSGLTVKPKNESELLPDFLNLQIHFLNDYIYSLSRGTAQRNLDVPKFRSIQIAYPKSLPEQQRIVSILDQAFAAIDQAKANAEQNLQNAKELFESYLQGVFEKKGDGWEEKLLENCFKLKSGDNLTAKQMVKGDFPVFGGNGIAGYHNKFNLSGSNVIVGRVGALCGNVRHINESIWLTDNAFKVVNYKYDFDHSFLTFLLNHKDLRSYARQAAQPVISNSSLKGVVLNFPKSIKEQQTIVRQLDALRAETQKMETIYQNKMDDLEELKKSILQKAFAGELPSGKEYDLRNESFPIAAEPEPTIQKQNG
jgi:type I restriction enzyme S subunit